MDLATRCGSGRVLNAPLLFGTSQGLLFIKKEMICLISFGSNLFETSSSKVSFRMLPLFDV